MVAPPAVFGPNIAGEVALEVLVPAFFEDGKGLEVLDVSLAGGVGLFDALYDWREQVIYAVGDIGASVYEDESRDPPGMMGRKLNPDHSSEGMPDVDDSIEPVSIHERYEVRGVDRYADRAVYPSRLSPAAQVHRQEAPAREPLRLQLVYEGAEGLGAPGEAVDQQGGVGSARVSPGDGSQVGGCVGHEGDSSF